MIIIIIIVIIPSHVWEFLLFAGRCVSRMTLCESVEFSCKPTGTFIVIIIITATATVAPEAS